MLPALASPQPRTPLLLLCLLTGVARAGNRHPSRPPPPLKLHSRSDLARLQRELRLAAPELQHAPVILLTYLTDVSINWLLGLTAAAHRVPLVVMGRGRRWIGIRGKLWGFARAAQLLSRVARHAAILTLDGSDTFVANPLSATARLLVHSIAHSRNAMLLVTECNAWPTTKYGRCRNSKFDALEQHRACKAAGWPACYTNSGAFVASGPSIVRVVGAMLGSWTEVEEHLTDQYSLQEVYRFQASHNVSIDVDGASEVMASLSVCRHHGRGASLNCFDEPWDPTTHLRVANVVGGAPGVSEITLSLANTTRRPFVFHSNGDPEFERINCTALQPAWAALLARRGELLGYRIVALDAARSELNVTTLGDFLALGHTATGRKWKSESFGSPMDINTNHPDAKLVDDFKKAEADAIASHETQDTRQSSRQTGRHTFTDTLTHARPTLDS